MRRGFRTKESARNVVFISEAAARTAALMEFSALCRRLDADLLVLERYLSQRGLALSPELLDVRDIVAQELRG